MKDLEGNNQPHLIGVMSFGFLCGVILLVAIFSLRSFLPLRGQESISYFGMWIAACWFLIWKLKVLRSYVIAPFITLEVWAWLAGALGIVWGGGAIFLWSGEVVLSVVLFCLFQSFILMFYGLKHQRILILPILILFLIVPFLYYLRFFIALPLRLISAQVAVVMLQGLDILAKSRGTEVVVGGEKIAVTAACSGIVLLETMIYLGWLVVSIVHPPGWRRAAHFSFLLPIVILSNSTRLVFLIVGFQKFGIAALTGSFHVWVGYGMVAAAAVLFWYGKVFFNVETQLQSIEISKGASR